MRWQFFVRRLAMLLASLLVASFVIFAALYLAPGSPVAALSGDGLCRRAAAIALIGLFAVKLRWFPALGNGTSFVATSDARPRLVLPRRKFATSFHPVWGDTGPGRARWD